MRKFDENGKLVYEGYGKIPVWVDNAGEYFIVYDGIAIGDEWEECKLELSQYITEIEGERHVDSFEDAEAVQAIYDKWLDAQQARYVREEEEAKREAEEAVASIASALRDESDYYFSRPNGYDLEFDSNGGASYDSLEQATGLEMEDIEVYIYRAIYRVISELEGE